jgi:hypothetical protein
LIGWQSFDCILGSALLVRACKLLIRKSSERPHGFWLSIQFMKAMERLWILYDFLWGARLEFLQNANAIPTTLQTRFILGRAAKTRFSDE